ncbi:hypothetical protein [Alicyclobacillus macrosporangiidus]|uniref:hypothetical protein n=1 Tax=Alicyclobacillus macrosporangiidus TaxID=392015 RepID=UPI000494FF48|nr:hypothetical protein [Alicyclobacillus macrosporangiidus]MCL6598893.1 hypothetical protein [Alicyclobacillus macrosporangiidus]
MKRLFAWWIALLFACTPGVALAAPTDAAVPAQSPAAVQITESGHPDATSAVAPQPVVLKPTAYRSGFRSPSPGVGTTRTYGSTYGSGGIGSSGVYTAPRPSIGSHLFSFGAGWLLGSMFHPFGYYGMGVYHSFSLFGLILDILLLVVLWKLVRWLFFRR